MNIFSLTVENFRKFRKKEFNFSGSYNIITGRNGVGKTSIFEAIYLLSTGKSFITNHIQNCVKFGKEYFFLGAKFQSREKKYLIEFLLGKNKKELRLNGKKAKSFSEIIGVMPVLFMNYKLSLIVKGGPENRRNFLNHLLIFSDKDYYKLLLKYYSILYRRNALLKENGDKSLLNIFTEEILPIGIEVQNRRINVIDKLKFLTKEMIFKITDKKFDVDIRYKKSNIEKLSSKEILINEINRRRTLFGPHLDEIEILLNGVPAREYSSLGEAYGLAFALRFAESRIIEEVKGDSPVIMLDDFFSDLDEFHRLNILDLAKNQQVFVSSLSLNIIPQEIVKNSQIIML